MELKKVFETGENGTLTYEQFMEIANKEKAKFVDLSEGKYVSSAKYTDEIAAKDKEIETLNSTINTRDTDLTSLKKQLEEAGVDAGKLKELTDSLSTLQSKYDTETKSYKDQLKKQAYEFAVKDFANTQKFTSSAAKREFIRSMIDAELKMDKDSTIMGAQDFVTSYAKDNSDSFVTEDPNAGNDLNNPDAGQQGFNAQGGEAPHFISSTPGNAGSNGSSTTGFNFSFTGVRPNPNQQSTN